MLGFESWVRGREVEVGGLQWSETVRSERTDPELQLFEKQVSGWRWETRSAAIAVKHMKMAVRELHRLRQIRIAETGDVGRGEWQEGGGTRPRSGNGRRLFLSRCGGAGRGWLVWCRHWDPVGDGPRSVMVFVTRRLVGSAGALTPVGFSL